MPREVKEPTGHEGHRKRLRERFIDGGGLEGFHDYEVLELLLTYAIPRQDVKPVAKRLMTRFGGLAAVLDAPLESLMEEDEIGRVAAVMISSIPKILSRYRQERWKEQKPGDVISSTADAVNHLSARLALERKEVFLILALDSKNKVIATEQIQEGTVNRTAVFPRSVVEAVVKHRATAVIMSHNHPGGDPTPSAADRQLTRRLKRMLNDLDVAVHDHIIIAGSRHYSFAENGGLE